MNQQKILELFKKYCTFDQTMGLDFKIHTPGEISYFLTVDNRHLSSPDTCHGGVISGMMDSTLGFAVLSYAATINHLCSTVEFKTNFISPAYLGDQLEGKGKLDYKGKSLIVASAEILNKNTGKLVAKGMGTFNLYPVSKRDEENWNLKSD